jgi:hypothetical protein
MAIKLPVSFKDFIKEPVKAMLYICLLAIGYLYVDGKMSAASKEKIYKVQVEKCEEKNNLQDGEITIITAKLNKSDSLLNRLASKFETLRELGKIQ